MPVSGYDPEDIDEEWEAYRRGDESLVDLLDGSEIKRIMDR